jgi:competence protein ComEC
LLLGEKKTMDENLQLALQRSGTTHLIALSGYNITIIVEAVYFLLIGIGVARPKSFFWVLIFLIFFIILTGASPSVVRAGIMGALLVLSNKLGKNIKFAMLYF